MQNAKIILIRNILQSPDKALVYLENLNLFVCPIFYFLNNCKNIRRPIRTWFQYIIWSFGEAVIRKSDINPKRVKTAQICSEYMSLNLYNIF